ncbi:F-box/WD repeat-containing protein 9 [Brachionichthys hirsutus]|uniref:F-box/WD repeat-containing protein 9 n=1 Tax=Brachionichthys hirsutus TaxID=412623 RepID=UPI003604DB17
MSEEVRVHLRDQDGPSPAVTVKCNDASNSDAQGPLPADQSASGDEGPSPAEASGLLSLPWEMVSHIASHLPARCVIAVLPKVCHALANVGKDSTTWQLRARRLAGSQAGFPVGSRRDFDWPTACLEMEQLITCWTGQGHLVARQFQEDVDVGQQQGLGRDGGQDGREDPIEGLGVVAYGGDEGMEVAMEGEGDEMQPVAVVDRLARLDVRGEDNPAAVMGEERDHRMVYDLDEGHDAARHDREHLAGLRNVGNGGQVKIEQRQPLRCPSPPPALEHFSISSGHFASVNSVLFLGGEGAVCATASRDWHVKLWDLQAGAGATLLHTLGEPGDFTHQGWVWCLASQGPLLATGCFDSKVRVWDLQQGGAGKSMIRAGAAVLCLSYQPDLLLAGTFDKRVSMYDTRVAEPLVKSIHLHSNAVMCLAADDRYIISGGKDRTVAVYDRRAGKALERLRMSSYLLSMSYSGNEVWAGDSSGMIRSFSMQAGTFKPLSQFDVGHTAIVTGIHRSPGSLYTSSSDRTVKVHIPCSPPRTLCTLHHRDPVNRISAEAGVLAVASGEVVEFWRPRK